MSEMVSKTRVTKRPRKKRINCDLSDPEFNRPPKKGYGFIYRLIFENGKEYIGQTIQTIARRIRGHKNDGTCIVDRYINSGPRFIVEKIDEVTTDILDDVERYYIKAYGTITPYGYNMTYGGRDRPTSSKESRERLSRSLKESYNRPENKAKAIIKLERTWRRNRKKIIRLEDGRIYRSIREASEDSGVNSISCVLTGIGNTANGYHFIYYSDYALNNREEIIRVLDDWADEKKRLSDIRKSRTHIKMYAEDRHKRKNPILCVETGAVYKNIEDASENITAGSSKDISRVLRGEANTIGGYHWIRYTDYYYDSRKEILSCFKEWEKIKDDMKRRSSSQRMTVNNPVRTAVRLRCIDNMMVYDSIGKASKELGISKNYLYYQSSKQDFFSVGGYRFEKISSSQ